MPAPSERVSYRKSVGGGSRQHGRNSDSGVGSSDHGSYASHDEFYLQYLSLRRAFENATDKIKELELENAGLLDRCTKATKEVSSLDSMNKGLRDRMSILEDDAMTLQATKDSLITELNVLKADNRRYQDELYMRATAPPVMSGANGSDRTEKSKLHRTSSKKESKSTSKKEKEPSKERSSRRVDRDDKSTATHTSRQSRQNSYYEPFGEGGRPPSSLGSGSIPTRRQSRSYSVCSTSRREFPAFSNLPRTIPSFEDAIDQGYPYESGNYVAHPLPGDTHRRRR
jgi:hypothetical protein